MTRLAAVVLSICCAATLVARQTPPSSDPPAVPVEQEPRHRLVFSNAYVRVIDALFPPLYVSQYHSHAADNVAVTILPGRDDAQGQARIGFVAFARGGYSHVATNPATLPMRFIDVELLAADRGDDADGNDQPGHEVVLTNARVRVSRVKLGAGQSLPEHRHAAGYVSVVVRGGDGPGAARWHGAAEPSVSLAAGKQPLELVEIEPR